jgi:hypothetical protein
MQGRRDGVDNLLPHADLESLKASTDRGEILFKPPYAFLCGGSGNGRRSGTVAQNQGNEHRPVNFPDIGNAKQKT